MHAMARPDSRVYSWTCSKRRCMPPTMASVTENETESGSLGSVFAIVRRRVPLTRSGSRTAYWSFPTTSSIVNYWQWYRLNLRGKIEVLAAVISGGKK